MARKHLLLVATTVLMLHGAALIVIANHLGGRPATSPPEVDKTSVLWFQNATSHTPTPAATTQGTFLPTDRSHTLEQPTQEFADDQSPPAISSTSVKSATGNSEPSSAGTDTSATGNDTTPSNAVEAEPSIATSRLQSTVSTDAAYAQPLVVKTPLISTQLGEHGRVVVRAQIGADGRATNPGIHTSSGYARLDNAAIKAVTEGYYVPATRDGVAHTRWFLIPINFLD